MAEVIEMPSSVFFSDRGALVVARLGEVIRQAGHVRTGDDGRLYRYQGGVYHGDGDTWARGQVRQLLGDRCKKAYFEEIVVWLKTWPST